MSLREPLDLAAEERPVHRLLAAIPPQTLPLGFRDAVMRRVSVGSTSVGWEWVVAAVLALPSLGFLAFQAATRGGEFLAAFNNLLVAATSDASQAFFFVDGLTVLALALLGLASLVAAHASTAASTQRTTTLR
jgi:hypothetical protein